MRTSLRISSDATWDKYLSLEEQRALGFACVLLHALSWVFLDDALAALDPAKREALTAILRTELSGSAVMSTGHGGSNDEFYDKILRLRTSACKGPNNE